MKASENIKGALASLLNQYLGRQFDTECKIGLTADIRDLIYFRSDQSLLLLRDYKISLSLKDQTVNIEIIPLSALGIMRFESMGFIIEDEDLEKLDNEDLAKLAGIHHKKKTRLKFLS